MHVTQVAGIRSASLAGRRFHERVLHRVKEPGEHVAEGAGLRSVCCTVDGKTGGAD